jgi:hypothetical protein
MTSDEALDRIRSRGHWRINVRPSGFDHTRIPRISDLVDAVASARVDLRGWPYPYFDQSEPPTILTDHIQQVVSWGTHHELWRFYQSAQFIHLFAMREDWWDPKAGEPNLKSGSTLSLQGTLFTLTEVFLFAARLAEIFALGPEVTVSYKLVDLGGRQLQTFAPNRVPLGPYRRTAAELHEFGQDVTRPAEFLMANAGEIAVDEAIKVYERFTWVPARENVAEDQRHFLERRW